MEVVKIRNVITRKVESMNLKEEIIIAISDVHLGYRDRENQDIFCNKESFNVFLRQIRDNALCNRLVICGDFLDMWRRDLAGVVLENADILNFLRDLKRSHNIEVNFVVGNHDYYLRRFKEEDFAYDFTFDQGLKLIDSRDKNVEYWFLHGDEFDFIQNEFFYDPLCLGDDNLGQLADLGWKLYLQTLGWFQRLIAFILGKKKDFNLVLLSAEERYKTNIITRTAGQPANLSIRVSSLTPDDFQLTEKNAYHFATEQEKLKFLVFGHTHKPFIHTGSNFNLVNTRSWVNHPQSPESNTYVRIHNQQATLCSFANQRQKEYSIH